MMAKIMNMDSASPYFVIGKDKVGERFSLPAQLSYDEYMQQVERMLTDLNYSFNKDWWSWFYNSKNEYYLRISVKINYTDSDVKAALQKIKELAG